MKAITVVPPLTGPGSRVMAPPRAAAFSRSYAQVAATFSTPMAMCPKAVPSSYWLTPWL